MLCAIASTPPPHSAGRPAVGTSPTSTPSRHLRLARRRAAAEQGSFSFLESVPVRQAERARPHLRGRTQPDAKVQLVLPFRPQRGDSLFTPERAEALESAIREAKRHPAGSTRESSSAGLLLQLLAPFLRSAARDVWASHPRTHLSRADLEQEALVHVLDSAPWRRFQPGRAGPGRTLFPAYVLQAVRQHLHRKVEDAAPVHVTDWGRKLASRARRRVEQKGGELGEALRAEGADAATARALELGAHRGELLEAREVEDEGEERRGELAQQAAALRALKQLPKLQRLAVTVA